MPSARDLNIPAQWDDAFGVITNLFDATGDDTTSIEDAEAAVWLCMTGAYEGQYFSLDVSELDLLPVH